MGYSAECNLPEMPSGPVDWPALFNELVAKLEAGRTLKLVAAVALVKGDPIYINNTGKAAKADGATNKALAIWQSSSTAVDAEGYAQRDGVMDIGSGWTPGGFLYCSATSTLTQTANGPVVGFAKSATRIVIDIQYS